MGAQGPEEQVVPTRLLQVQSAAAVPPTEPQGCPARSEVLEPIFGREKPSPVADVTGVISQAEARELKGVFRKGDVLRFLEGDD